jgi:hypothetical protein
VGFGVGGLGVGAGAPTPNPQSPIPNPQSPIPNYYIFLRLKNIFEIIKFLIIHKKIIIKN